MSAFQWLSVSRITNLFNSKSLGMVITHARLQLFVFPESLAVEWVQQNFPFPRILPSQDRKYGRPEVDSNQKPGCYKSLDKYSFTPLTYEE